MPTREIEVKARLRDYKTILEKLNQLGCVFSPETTQIDRIFIPIGSSIPVAKGVNVLRLRRENRKILLTLKQVNNNQLDKIEKEFYVSDEEKAIDAILLLGFQESVSVEKKRKKCILNDYEICIDTVTNLGQFIEIEKITDEETDIVQSELFSFLESIGVNKTDQVFMGYDILISQKS
jgi:adenylate cyclase class 2